MAEESEHGFIGPKSDDGNVLSQPLEYQNIFKITDNIYDKFSRFNITHQEFGECDVICQKYFLYYKTTEGCYTMEKELGYDYDGHVTKVVGIYHDVENVIKDVNKMLQPSPPRLNDKTYEEIWDDILTKPASRN